MSKRIFCLVLAMMLTLGASVSALADEATLPTTGNDTTISKAGEDNGVEAVLSGTIKVTNLVVTVPTSIPFTIDPSVSNNQDWVEDGSNKNVGWLTEQITQPENITITNDSVVPVEISVSKVQWSQYMNSYYEKPEDLFYNHYLPTVVESGKDKNWLEDERQILVGMYATGGKYDTSIATQSTALLKDDYYGNSTHKIRNGESDDTFIEADGGTMDLKLWGRASQKGWTDGEDFSVTVTLVASIYKAT